MLKSILTSLRSPELRKKLLFTAFILAVYRFGSYVPTPGVNLDALVAKGLVKNNANRDWPVKLLAQGEIDRALTVRVHAASAAARTKIEAAGGTVEIIGEAGTTD